ncbi:TIGR04211 family SH3 domain-containing protein [Hydrocarboniphaga effusa]|jgi:SH3 domain protein|uniref:TIGR04211 family SH3 domain-containing protein n=1 Tax=Hydrocarboniphaga effusa TaxID=243629 RepID=UPI003137E214
MALSLVLASAPAFAQEGGRNQYISDDISVTLRDAPRNDAASVGAVNSGDKVTVLQTLGAQSFAQVKTADGRTGWLTARYISAEPAAKTRLKELQSQLAEAQSRIKALDAELADAKALLEKAKPAFELSGENERLQQALESAEQQSQAAASRYDTERARRRTLVTGASLVGGGILVGLILPWLGAGKRRRRSDF